MVWRVYWLTTLVADWNFCSRVLIVRRLPLVSVMVPGLKPIVRVFSFGE